jgi:hypothetical protein
LVRFWLFDVLRRSDYYAFDRAVNLQRMFAGSDADIPLVVHVAYQMMFAIITPRSSPGRSLTALGVCLARAKSSTTDYGNAARIVSPS